ncbi:rhomboid family intramembrane serine protease [Chryseobacterium sp.]|uniref:rhomboid family intramembrane serine protease n=1 Tax=Chryseobacterium sp. TaxID=1871047 RepID=UPI0011C795B4|nr:rhomboid family intramembrane serine protease [Chryseobacterium sp.]TXF76407.1 rhomboid family intramembrane serine protease [Chryseobacterium sp.]
MLKKTISKNALLYPFLMLSAMWGGYFLQLHGFFESCSGAIIPLVPEGMKGIFFSPLLHGNFEHLLGNSIPIAVLMFLLFQFYPEISKKIFFMGWILSGLLVWLLPPIDIMTGDSMYLCIIGASGIVYVLAFFLFFSGVFRWNVKFLTISLIVVLYYGSLVWGMLPEELFSKLNEPSRISWQSHLAGAVVGSIMAFLFRKTGEKKKKFIWQFPNYYNEKDDLLWQQYKENHPEDFMEMPQKKKDDIWEYLDEIRRKQ